MRYIAILLILITTGCVSDQRETGSHSGKGKSDVIAQGVYDQIMGKILSHKIGFAGNGSNFRKGDKVPYRNQLPAPHKAMAACMVWNTAFGKASYKAANFSYSRDWGYAEVSALDFCESTKRQKSLNCKCQTIDHDDVNVLDVPDDFRQAYKRGAQAVTSQPQKIATNKNNEQQYKLFLQWENLIPKKERYQVLVTQVGKVGTAKSISLIAGKKCDATFRFTDGDFGEWEVTCTDGSKATGVIQALGRNKGSKGSGFDAEGNKLNFVMVPILS